MSERASAAQAGPELSRPNLVPLLSLMTLACVISAYFLYTTYAVRQPATQYTADGRAYILRLSEPLDMPPEIKADGIRLMNAIAQVQQRADQLKADVTKRSAEERAYEIEVSEFLAQLEEAEQTIADLKQEIGALRQARRETPTEASDVTRIHND